MMSKRLFRVGNKQGVHGRVATRLAEISVAHEGSVTLKHGEETVACDSILEVLSLGLVEGSEVEIMVEGTLVEQTLEQIGKVLTSVTDPSPER